MSKFFRKFPEEVYPLIRKGGSCSQRECQGLIQYLKNILLIFFISKNKYTSFYTLGFLVRYSYNLISLSFNSFTKSIIFLSAP